MGVHGGRTDTVLIEFMYGDKHLRGKNGGVSVTNSLRGEGEDVVVNKGETTFKGNRNFVR